MKVTPYRPDAEHYDPADYTLWVTVRADNGLVEIQHQAEPDHIADRRMARLAAEIIDEIGPGPVVEQLGAAEVAVTAIYPMAVEPPARGRAVMACRCGTVMNLADMRRLEPRYEGSAAVVRPIVCRRCAA